MIVQLAGTDIQVNGKISYTLTNGYGEIPIPDRPLISSATGSTVWHLSDEMHDWLEKHEASYSITYESFQRDDLEFIHIWGINILDNNVALMFKLAWGGQ